MEGSEGDNTTNKSVQDPPNLDHHQEHLGLGLGFQHSPPDPNLDPSSSSPPPPPPPDDLDPTTAVYEELQNQPCIDGELEDERKVDEEFRSLVLEDKGVDDRAIAIDSGEEEVVDGDERDGSERNVDREEEGGVVEEDEDRNESEVVDDDDGWKVDDDGDGDGWKVDDGGWKADGDGDGWKADDDGWKVDGDGDGDGDYRGENNDGFDGNENVGGGDGDGSAVALAMEGKYRRYHYPVRTDAEDCSYYLRTGTCKFGSNCKFNHPPKKRNHSNQAAKEKVTEKEENPEKPGQIECKYYLRSGGCKYGKACRFNHNRGRTPAAPNFELNFVGLPIRPGEQECPYYMRNGSCKYGSHCRFNHPDPTTVGGGDTGGYGNGRSVASQGASKSTMSSWSSPRTLNETPPFVPMMFSPTHGVPSVNTEWNSYQAPIYPAREGTLPTPPAFAMSIPAAETNFYTHPQQQMVVEEFPERPGQPECSYFMKTGDCKYRSGCKFHHPKNRISTAPPFALSDKGLPLRPDQNVCTHYNRYGICKFGPSCKFDHPVNFALSSSSGMSGPPDHPPPFGNSVMAGRARMGGTENGSKPLIQQRV